jgi:hypothetical protein
MDTKLNLPIIPNIYFGFPKLSPEFALGDLVVAKMGTSTLFCSVQGIYWASSISDEKNKEWQYSLEIHAHLGDGSVTVTEELGQIIRTESSLETATEEMQEIILQAENSLWLVSAGGVDE